MLSALIFGTNGARFFSPGWAPVANAAYSALRRYQSLYHVGEGLWLVTRYADAKTILQDTRFSSSDQWRTVGPVVAEFEYDPMNSILYLDPPHHTRLRSLVLLEKPSYRSHIVLRGFIALEVGFEVADVRNVA